MSNGNGPKSLQPVTFPWEGDDEITANLAIGSLRDSLLMWLKSEKGVHAETLLVSIGALAGFAAQNAVWAMVHRTGRQVPRLERDKPPAETGFLYVVTTSGEKFYVGEILNGYLFPEGGLGAGYTYTLWGFVAAAAITAGVAEADLPSYREIARRVATTVGTKDFGVLPVFPNISAHLRPRNAVEEFWPHVRFIMSRTDGPGPAAGRSVAPEHWPIVTAQVARQFVTYTKDFVDPKIAVALIMEAAIAMAKIDPASVPQTLPQEP